MKKPDIITGLRFPLREWMIYKTLQIDGKILYDADTGKVLGGSVYVPEQEQWVKLTAEQVGVVFPVHKKRLEEGRTMTNDELRIKNEE